jgi:hypothetical protein
MASFAMGGQSAFTLAGQPMGMGQQTMPMMQSHMYGQQQQGGYPQVGGMSSQGYALTPQQQQQYMMQQQQMQQMYQAQQPQQLQGQYPAQPSASRQGSLGPRSVAM